MRLGMSSLITDPNTLSNHHAVVTEFTIVDVALSFAESTVSGDVTYRFRVRAQDGIEELVLDTSYLDIKKVTVGGKEAKWTLDDRTEPFGSALHIILAHKYTFGQIFEATISYSTTGRCTALQWMAPEQTSNKKHPYMCTVSPLSSVAVVVV